MQIGKRDFAQSMHTVHLTSYFIVLLLHKHPNETTLTEWAFVWLCVRAVAAVQCEVCTQRTAACDCQSYDSFRNSWSSNVVTLPSPSEFNFISPCLSCSAILLSHPPTEALTFIILDLKVSHQIPYYLPVPHSFLSELLVSHVDLKLAEEKEVCDNITQWHTSKKKKEGSCIKKSWQIQTTFADFATAKIPFKCIYLYLWQESKEKRKTQMTQEWEQKQSSSRWRQREWQRVTQQSCEDERMLLIHDLSADSIIIWDKCPRTNQSGSDNSTQQYY